MKEFGFLIQLYCFGSFASLTTQDCSFCLSNDCDRDGRCRRGCVAGRTGLYCTGVCPQHCRNSNCFINRYLGIYDCVEGCADGYCGPECTKRCSENCPLCSRQQCNICNRTSCQQGYYGVNCDSCNPKFAQCDRETGRCIKCKEGFYGDDCGQRCKQCISEDEDRRYNCQSGCNICLYGLTLNYDNLVPGEDTPGNSINILPIAVLSTIYFCTLMFLFAFIYIKLCRRKSNEATTRKKGDYVGIPLDEPKAVDLVEFKYKEGEKWITVSGPVMTLDSTQVHSNLQVKDKGREMTNCEKSGRRPGQFREFYGTCSSPIPVSASPSVFTIPRYWETTTQLQSLRTERVGVILEMGLVEEESLDHFAPLRSWCVSVQLCRQHPHHLCIQVYREMSQAEVCISLPRPEVDMLSIFSFGLVVDVNRGRVGFIDLERNLLLCKFDVRFRGDVYPVFYACPFHNFCDVRMRLVSGREISVNESKKLLMKKVLS